MSMKCFVRASLKISKCYCQRVIFGWINNYETDFASRLLIPTETLI